MLQLGLATMMMTQDSHHPDLSTSSLCLAALTKAMTDESANEAHHIHLGAQVMVVQDDLVVA